ncbi:HvfC family RiPP maturation protein [Thiocapsa bogorovii]|uniref:HvfC family RiPP maturation protein n=1 Tax=Thiocapsa bogorovii TaxID=521689 RepID=UPI001E4DA09B|nr:putative DNA-binding domain-containing protein [Thiocapsa bogorovii]UHD16534.1 putative DNA-binding domain-containing protein [Thiocapsa bogorovii]
MPEQADIIQPDFIRRQRAFAAHLRDPTRIPGPEDVEDRRMAIYRDLVFNNVSALLAGNFPVLRRILSDACWDDLIRDFFVRHRAKTPIFLELGQEFLDFLQSARTDDPRDPPFLLELAHYEWVELALQISDVEPDRTRIDPTGDLLEGRPVVSPLAWNLSYRFPVHRIGPDCRPDAPPPEPTHLVVYRTANDDIAFLEINAVTQRLLILLGEQTSPQTGRAALNRIAAELGHTAPDKIVAFGAELLEDLRTKGVVLGTGR